MGFISDIFIHSFLLRLAGVNEVVFLIIIKMLKPYFKWFITKETGLLSLNYWEIILSLLSLSINLCLK